MSGLHSIQQPTPRLVLGIRPANARRPRADEPKHQAEIDALAAKIAATWRTLPKGGGHGKANGRLSHALLTHASEVMALFGRGARIMALGRALKARGVTCDHGGPLGRVVVNCAWLRIEKRLAKRVAERRFDQIHPAEIEALATRIAETWHALAAGEFRHRTPGRLSEALMTHAAETLRLFRRGARKMVLGRALAARGVTCDKGHPLGGRVIHNTWRRVEERLMRRVAEQRREAA